jgi:SpoVK/Ycf46/Vps4 family AAA+-type ATPase
MYTELMKIIEGGLKGDKDKVINYSKMLAINLEKDGQVKIAEKIRNTIQSNNTRMVALDSFNTKPVDQESRMDIADIKLPTKPETTLIFDKFINDEVNDFIDTFYCRDRLKENGIDLSSSLLLYGPPGCGKTSLVEYISYKTELPLVTARFDALVSSLLGNTAKNIRKIFEYASKKPCILFLDEFDVIAKVRDDKNELGELKRVVNSLLQNIDEFNQESILIAATNHHELLDSAIWRRFTKVIELNKPSSEAKAEIIKGYIGKYKTNFLDNNKKFNLLVSSFENMSPSDIKNIVFTSIKKTIMSNKTELDMTQILYEVYLFSNHNISNETELAKFLYSNGVTQKEVIEFLNLSSRRVREILK